MGQDIKSGYQGSPHVVDGMWLGHPVGGAVRCS